MKVLEKYLTYICTEQMARASYDFSRPYEQLRADYHSCARSCDRFKYQRKERSLCIANCKVLVTKKELRLAIYELKRCGRIGNLRCQDSAKKKILKVQKKLRNNLLVVQKYRASQTQ